MADDVALAVIAAVVAAAVVVVVVHILVTWSLMYRTDTPHLRQWRHRGFPL